MTTNTDTDTLTKLLNLEVISPEEQFMMCFRSKMGHFILQVDDHYGTPMFETSASLEVVRYFATRYQIVLWNEVRNTGDDADHERGLVTGCRFSVHL